MLNRCASATSISSSSHRPQLTCVVGPGAGQLPAPQPSGRLDAEPAPDLPGVGHHELVLVGADHLASVQAGEQRCYGLYTIDTAAATCLGCRREGGRCRGGGSRRRTCSPGC